MPTRSAALFGLVLVPAVALALAACGSPAAGDDDGRVAVVASTDVYGDIASAIGGDLVSVTSLIDSAAQDPHSYEASARDRLAVSEAALVIENGGGYDPFMSSLIEASPSEGRVVIDVVEVSGLAPEDAEEHAEEEHAEEGDHGHAHIEGFNEHVWYDLHTIEHLAETIAESLRELDPSGADTFDANVETFLAGLEVVHEQAMQLAESVDGLEFALTEPVPAYLFAELGLVNVTPEAFSEAIEEGSDVAPRDLEAMLDIIDSSDLLLLAYNDQTTNAQTEQVRAAAEAAGVPVVSFTETLPEGLDYLEWMSSNLDAIAAAVAR
jgi:zinc/manganese transport system substrate-binding protein